MELINEFKSVSSDTGKLQKFINERIDDLYDYYSLSNFTSLEKDRDFLKNLSTVSNISQLDFTNSKNEAFLNLLLTNATRLNEPFSFDFFYKLLIDNELKKPFIVQASSIFMNSRHAETLIDSYAPMLELLNQAYLKESDGSKDPVVTLLNYYATAIKHFGEFNESRLLQIQKLIYESRIKDDKYFLKEGIIEDALNIKLDFNNNPYSKIQDLIDGYLRQGIITVPFIVGNKIIETGTAYADIINQHNYSMGEIWQLNREYYDQLADTDIIFQSLGRGTAILTTEEQLTVYMSQLGRMHFAKLQDALKGLPLDLSNVHLFDWGSGQGPAAKIFLDKYNSENIKSVTLIEPSQAALKRASLHISQNLDLIRTVNKDFDSLEMKDIELNKVENDTTVHIFSNVIDMEFFNLGNLINLLVNSSKGLTYYVVVSPFINITKTQRIETFVDELCEEVLSHKILLSEELKSGAWNRNWSKVIRVFKTHN